MKKGISLVIFFTLYFSASSQTSLHEKYRLKMKQYAQMAFSYETTECLIISLTSEEDMVSYTVTRENDEKVEGYLNEAFDAASCNNCKQSNKVVVEKPIDYLYSNLSDYKVVLIKRNKDKFSVTTYIDELVLD